MSTLTRRPRPFRFGVLAESAGTRRQLLDTAQRAEDAGFSTLLVRDHFIAEPFGHQLAPLAALAAVAGVTKRLRVGSFVLSAAFRHPVILAKEIATLDVLSEGRAELGLGTGFSRLEYERAGMPFESPGTRVGRLGEVVRVLKGLFSGQPFTFAGKHYVITDLESFPAPVQQPHPPILIAGAGPRLLSLAAREADIVGLQSVDTSRGELVSDPSARRTEPVARKINIIRQAANGRFPEIELNTFASVIVTDRREDAAARFAGAQGWSGVPAAAVFEMPSVFIGSGEHIIAEMQTRREQLGFSYYVVSDRVMQDVAPIVGRLAGA